MKQSRLPEIDLANIAPIQRELKPARLRGFDTGGGGWSYDPSRMQVGDVFHADTSLGLSIPPRSLPEIEKEVVRQCRRGQDQVESNLEVTRLLSNWVSNRVTNAVQRHIPSLGLGTLGAVRYCSNVVAQIDDRPAVLFMDHRRKKGLTALGRQFAFSMMHEQVRVPDPELCEAELYILQFVQRGQERHIVEYRAGKFEPYSFAKLNFLVTETYEILAEVRAQKTSTASTAPLKAGLFG